MRAAEDDGFVLAWSTTDAATAPRRRLDARNLARPALAKCHLDTASMGFTATSPRA
jgi:hypothetical protein